MIKLEVEICCILGICCGGRNDAKQRAALSAKMQRETGVPADVADKMAAWVVQTFDLAPAGSLRESRDTVAALAREYDYES